MKPKNPPAKTASSPARHPKTPPTVQMSLMVVEPDAATLTPPKTKTPRLPKPPVTKAAKSVPVKADKKTARTETVRIVPETLLTSGAVWKMSGKNGVAYVKDAALAGELLATDPKNLPKAAMAVYYDKKGKAFAWQVRFDTDRWDEVMKRLA